MAFKFRLIVLIQRQSDGPPYLLAKVVRNKRFLKKKTLICAIILILTGVNVCPRAAATLQIARICFLSKCTYAQYREWGVFEAEQSAVLSEWGPFPTLCIDYLGK